MGEEKGRQRIIARIGRREKGMEESISYRREERPTAVFVLEIGKKISNLLLILLPVSPMSI
jgi:hypothetical protein